MSARQVFVMCIDCWEMSYGQADSNGVYQRDSSAGNHHDHAVHVFGPPMDYDAPIKNVLVRLHAGLPISDAAMQMFSLYFAISALQPNNGVKVKETSMPEHREAEVEKEPKEQESPAVEKVALF